MASPAVTLALGVLFLAACVVGLTFYARWIWEREERRRRAADTAHIPEAHEVAATERELMEDEMVAILDDAQDHVERLVFAAEIAELEASA